MIDPALWSAIKVKRRRRKEKKALRTAQLTAAPIITIPAAPQKAATPLSYDVVNIPRTMNERGYSDMEPSFDDVSIIESNAGMQNSPIELGNEPVTSEDQLVECSENCSRDL